MIKMLVIPAIALATNCAFAAGNAPDCSAVERWPTRSALVQLQNVGITDERKLDFTKTQTFRLASEEIGKNLYRQIHLVVFTEKSGRKIEIITSNEASHEECSMSAARIFVVSRQLGGQ